MMGGTTPQCAKLIGDSGSGFESTLISDSRFFRCTIGEDDHIASEQAGLLGRRAFYNTGDHAAALHVETREDANAGIGDTTTRKNTFQSAPP
jgi:hypothetical protein